MRIEETYSWSFTSAELSREEVLLLHFINWMAEAKRKKMNESELKNRTFCLDPKENLAVVNVYYETFVVETITEHLQYPWSSFIGTLGGMLGLYAGLSFISILEVMEWIFNIFLYGWRKPRPEAMGSKR
ncbi:unnamed protein product [Darwinula stevensoni]|uniref:Uncharacterized protein n=1 Tax=Darwinula stevensoni TaxID=69355 RepID=A0A7R9A781_9CRUS|nr:unnamed protein product [Darwinula stevensoni]CAG0890624.1 unnamed protein product [Darwinula stevensoni]